MTISKLRLSEMISPAFYDMHRDIKKHGHQEYVLYGGRGSTKSSFISIEVVLLIKKYENLHAVILRKVGSTIRTSVFNQYLWAIDELGLTSEFKVTKAPPELTRLKTGQKIMFLGLDDPQKLKSLKVPFSYVGILHFEELDQYAGPEEVRNVEQSVLRGGDAFYSFKSFNPPITMSNWANQYVQTPKPDCMLNHSTYLTTPAQWLGQKFIDDAEFLKEKNERAYKHEYLGIPTGTGGNVFENVEIKAITDDEIKGFDRIFKGIDWGWYPDPTAFDEMYFSSAKRELYIFKELHVNKMRSTDVAANLEKIGVNKYERITADKELETIADFRSWGWNMRPAAKGPGSITYGMKWLQSLNKIIIDPIRCPHTKEEFIKYEYERDRNGDVISGYPDKDNHHIDAVRYALEQYCSRRGQ